jgi:fluoroquinolone resistance protein
VDIHGKNFTSESLEELRDLDISELEECTFTRLDFSDLSFRSWRFIECQFIKCSFSEVDLVNTTFREVAFQECRLMGVNWTACRSISDPNFEHCKMDYSVFQGLDLRKISFLNCSAKEVDFSNCNLSGAIFSGTMLQNASFNQSDLRNADLRDAIRYFIDPQYTKLKGAKVDFPEASSILTAIGLEVSFH